MTRIRLFRLKRRVMTFLRFILLKKSHPSSKYFQLNLARYKPGPISKLLTCLKALTFRKKQSLIPDRTYEPLLDDSHMKVPPGKIVVYVGSEDGANFRRFLVPVIYFNHPLFGELLREAEEEFGFDHPGGITIPCRVTDFEKIQTKIAAGRRKFGKKDE